MADKKITDLQLRSSVTDGLSLPVDDGTQTYRITTLQMLEYISDGIEIGQPQLVPSAITGQTSDAEPALADSILTYDQSATALKKTTLESLVSIMRAKQLVDNGEFRYWQRGTPITRQDAVYGPDRWYFLTGGGATNVMGNRDNAAVSGEGVPYLGVITQRDATARQFGIAQILEYEKVIALRGKKLTLTFKASAGASSTPNIRAGVVEWTGLADSPTRDLVATWAATPSLVTNAAFLNTPTDLALNSSLQEYTLTVTVGANATNLYIFFWTPTAQAQNNLFALSKVRMVDHWESLPYEMVRRNPEDELRRCQVFFEKSYPVDTALGTAVARPRGRLPVNGNLKIYDDYKVTKFKAPTVTFYSGSDGTAGVVSMEGTNAATSSIGSNQQGHWATVVSTASALTTDYHFGSDAEI